MINSAGLPLAPRSNRRSNQNPLLRLPSSVRTRIYRNVLGIDGSRQEGQTNRRGTLPEFANQPAITQTCGAVRAETIPLFYSSNIFIIPIDGTRGLQTARKWISAIGNHNVKHMQHVIIIGFDSASLKDTRVSGFKAVQVGIDLYHLLVTGVQTELLQKRGEHLRTKRGTLQGMRNELNGRAVSSRTLCKLLASFAQVFGEVWKRTARIPISHSTPVYTSLSAFAIT